MKVIITTWIDNRSLGKNKVECAAVKSADYKVCKVFEGNNGLALKQAHDYIKAQQFELEAVS